MLQIVFLSCLCGRELTLIIDRRKDGFLSCLCGRERRKILSLHFISFLSCLCGRERKDSRETG
nr:hypothetical protein [Desulfobacter sp. UBA2225]